MGKLAFVFPGQGSQYIGMGKELFQTSKGKQALETAEKVLGSEFIRIIEEGPEEALRLTSNTQPAILLVSIAAWHQLDDAGIKPDYFAGHSLGEYSAHVAAGSLPLADALKVVRRRGELMQEAVRAEGVSMAAVLGLNAEQVEEACSKASDEGLVSPANYNSPGQIVISGEGPAVSKAMEWAKQLGAKRVLPLSVSGPFHTVLMKGAAEKLKPVLESIQWNSPCCPVIANVDASEVKDSGTIIDTLVRQVSRAVLWEQSILYLSDQGVDTFVECGPGKVLSGLGKKIVPGTNHFNVEDMATLEKSLAYLKESR